MGQFGKPFWQSILHEHLKSDQFTGQRWMKLDGVCFSEARSSEVAHSSRVTRSGVARKSDHSSRLLHLLSSGILSAIHSQKTSRMTPFFAQFECAPLSSIIQRGVFSNITISFWWYRVLFLI